MADDQKPLKVSDFRMFTPDGRLKPEYEELENAAPPPPAAESAPAARGSSDPGPEQEPEPPPEGAADSPDESEFLDLVRSLATSAYASLGLLAEPGARTTLDLPGARRFIDWLSMLERKTRNNLSFSEQNLLSRVLYELRLAFVEASGPARPAQH
ncbi:MAG: DUF1844 domain-containing protein [Thermoanaerobaculia bacterium]